MNARKQVSVSNRPWLVACNQAGVAGESHYGFGTLWMRYDRRGDFSRAWTRIADAEGCDEPLTWADVRRGPSHRMAQTLVDHFFGTGTLAFHCLVVDTDIVNLDCHGGDFDLARRKHLTMLLVNKIKCIVNKRGDQQVFRVWAAPIASRYDKAAEAVEVISGNCLAAKLSGRKPSIEVRPRPAADTPAIQLCDLLLGAVVSAWNRDASNREKRALQQQIARHLGWPDLRGDTLNTERKFNIWKFYDPAREPARSATTRTVRNRQTQTHFRSLP